MRRVISVLMAVLFAVSSNNGIADERTAIQLEVIAGTTYRDVIGNSTADAAKTMAEQRLVNDLGELIRYFRFVPSTEPASHRLRFVIDTPPTDDASRFTNVYDFNVFVSLHSDSASPDSQFHWLFRDAASSLNGADTAQSITDSLSQQVRNTQHHKIATELLNQISFTNKARFFTHNDRYFGWIIEHSAHQLCLDKRTLLQIQSEIPGLGFEEEFSAEVKTHKDDGMTTFTLTKDDVTDLLSDPASAQVLAVHVINYQRKCRDTSPITATAPSDVSFEGGSR